MVQALSFLSAANLTELPRAADGVQAGIEWERWQQCADRAAAPALAAAMREIETSPAARILLEAIFGNSPFLTRLALREPETLVAVLDQGADATLADLLRTLNLEHANISRLTLMSQLRVAKSRAALIVALADIIGAWPLERVTGALSLLAEKSLSAALRQLLTEAASGGQIELAHPTEPERDCGVIVLGMGKLGARELNYSSDIDLIILFDPDKIRYRGRDSVQGLMARLARDLVKLMEERTVDGYVFRTDLRLRPDPASTPPAVSVAAAESYYGSLGQNWERAALIKARPVAGDLAAGHAFLTALVPFLWRKHLDFAAIRDIHSIKRQIDARQGQASDSLAGHNVKLGRGGIREIEFFVQTQQLIWGGRLPTLRSAGTVETLDHLVDAGRIPRGTAEDLSRAYRFLRRVEHRLQMIDDNQTHSLPGDPEGLRRLAIFLGYDGAPSFNAALAAELESVAGHFRALFRDAPSLTAEGNLAFTGKEADPETIDTLQRMGFRHPGRVDDAIRAWHRGQWRATRSARARELLTELTPALLRMLGRSGDPDLAFARFDEFVSRLPSGVQLFSLFQHHPELFGLIAEIMGDAPALASQLAHRPVLLDCVLAEGLHRALPAADEAAAAELAEDLRLSLGRAKSFEEVLDATRRWAGDRKFQIGVELLQGVIDGVRAGRDFTLIAETTIAALLPAVETDFARPHGRISGGEFTVLGLGKLGSREMNAHSDLDLIFVYRADPAAEASDGQRKLPVMTYFARLGQRVISALSALTAEGNLYEVDMRLRPSGNGGPIASSLDAFRRYHAEQAWTWERMALTRARVVAGAPDLAADLAAAIRDELTRPRDPAGLLADVADMRHRIAAAHPAPPAWDCKHRRGGLIDLDFIAQYLLLATAPQDPSVLVCGTEAALGRLTERAILTPASGRALIASWRLWQHVQQLLRVALGKLEVPPSESELVERVLARAVATGLRRTGRTPPADRLAATARRVGAAYERLLERPASRQNRPAISDGTERTRP